ncbi:ribonucleoside-triphosphate reductase [Oceanobacillus oncorhynchi subsp. incaldanensis]|uniref:Anaerobic ribonucleoside triphosphate reductase n=1 Tax=Oceanobacillus aidingensis TaxID=645964 RepID=A0ABV9JZU3_9BACI|nr:anaerobic ribonucleoside triphosphate reductase [Oceanobacillus oncorhynchi]MDM8098560.1 anaerobic ribonucleoside triphosphate reductase [Oceanobacillus oncorhynchi]UUI39018.1 anaerobic ribonucleoside triphosphate reductase [Oceanobacillus oncorhynchi]GIO19191.1 ribonucleoside-triphosphate reductase [Oceanobacillus oncorhynchi subsp. incaldanensis]
MAEVMTAPESTEADLMQDFQEIVSSTNQDLIQENANVDGKSPCGQMNKFASESAKLYAKEKMLSREAKQAMEDNYIHIHDLDYMPTGTATCCQIPLGKLLEKGFNTGHGHMRSPQSILSAMALAAIVFQSNQNQQHGGQSFQAFDYDLAPFVKKSYQKRLHRLQQYQLPLAPQELEKLAWEETDRECYQACEAFIHNLNSLHSRSGGQVPFTSINYGTDTSREGRLIIKNLLLATQAGLGKGETPIFPIQIFKMKKDVNFYKADPNYDLYQLALETTAKRLFPNFSFIDAPFNFVYYEEGNPDSEVAYMGCRTRIMANRHGEENSLGRGNISFTSINLVKIALTSSTVEAFMAKLEVYTEMVIRQLYERYVFQANKLVNNFTFLHGEGVWTGSDELNPEDTLEEVLKQGSLSVGFIGLAECLKALTGKHHGESEQAQELGEEIVAFLRKKCDEAAEDYDLNYSLIATPAEGLSGRFVKQDCKDFGKRDGITDRDYYTNSFHIPVYYPIRAVEKIKREAVYHPYTNAGHITYIEVDGDVSKNIKAIDTLVKTMAESGIGYGSVNHPVDRCQSCGYTGTIDNECPSCQIADERQFDRIRRITGYLVGTMDKWNTAKASEERDRVRHV